jgi:WhiB family redox-sensing transcriptional regulator
MTAMDNRASWWLRAACATADPELFFPISHSGPALRQVRKAKAVCARCQIQPECLRYALDAGPVQGVWGGMTEEERRRLLRRKRRARARPQHERTGGPVRVPEPARAR